jgi:MarR family transcriptional regulator for hemolysin
LRSAVRLGCATSAETPAHSTQMRALAVLSVSSSVTINELSVFAVTERSTMSRPLASLAEQGYIRRQPRPDDMRIRDVRITAK